jgi:hypothetical protein
LRRGIRFTSPIASIPSSRSIVIRTIKSC